MIDPDTIPDAVCKYKVHIAHELLTCTLEDARHCIDPTLAFFRLHRVINILVHLLVLPSLHFTSLGQEWLDAGAVERYPNILLA